MDCAFSSFLLELSINSRSVSASVCSARPTHGSAPDDEDDEDDACVMIDCDDDDDDHST